MWQLIDKRVSTRRDPQYGKADRRRLGKEIRKGLAKDRRRRTEEAGAEVEALMRDPRHNTDYYMVLGCLPGAPLEATRRYQRGQKRWPVRPPAEPLRTQA